MQVTCPGCKSRFLLPEGIRDGVRLRCSVCREEFPYVAPRTGQTPEPSAAPAPGEPPLSFSGAPAEGALPEFPARKRGLGPLWAVIVILAAALVAAWHYVPEFQAWTLDLRDKITGQPSQARQAGTAGKPAAKTGETQSARQNLILRDVRQFFVDNEQLGRVLVIEGKIFNQGLETYGGIEVEAALLGSERRAIASLRQKAGVRLSNFQLKVMSKAEMVQALNSEPEIALTNGRVPPAAQVPFMVVFFEPSRDVSEFAVKVGHFDLVEQSALSAPRIESLLAPAATEAGPALKPSAAMPETKPAVESEPLPPSAAPAGGAAEELEKPAADVKPEPVPAPETTQTDEPVPAPAPEAAKPGN